MNYYVAFTVYWLAPALWLVSFIHEDYAVETKNIIFLALESALGAATIYFYSDKIGDLRAWNTAFEENEPWADFMDRLSNEPNLSDDPNYVEPIEVKTMEQLYREFKAISDAYFWSLGIAVLAKSLEFVSIS
jgi:hypothetical protein